MDELSIDSLYKEKLFFYLRNKRKLSGSYCSNLLKFFKDIYTPTVIDGFYNSGEKDFLGYVEKLNTLDFEKFKTGYEVFLKIEKTIIFEVDTLLDRTPSNSAKMVSDFHPGFRNKYKIDDYIIYKDPCDWEKQLGLLINLFNFQNVLIPSYSYDENFKKRRFIESNLEAVSEKALNTFYHNLASFLPLLLSIRTIDLILDNIVIDFPNIYLIDLETIYTPSYRKNFEKDDYGLYRSGFLKKPISDQVDFSMYTGSQKRVYSYLSGVLSGSKTKPVLKWKVPSKGNYMNIPMLQGRKVYPIKYKKSLMEGFLSGVNELKKKKEKIIDLSLSYKQFNRTILRPTYLYRSIFLLYFFPEVYQKQSNLDNYLNTELKARNIVLHKNVKDQNDIIKSEITQLKNGFIPIFYHKLDDANIYDIFGNSVGQFFVKPKDALCDLFSNKLDIFFAKQIKLIEKANT